MRTKEELEQKRSELIQRYTQLYCEGKQNSEECRIVIAERNLIEWVLKVEYFTIQ
jgi:hypothetical protein